MWIAPGLRLVQKEGAEELPSPARMLTGKTENRYLESGDVPSYEKCLLVNELGGAERGEVPLSNVRVATLDGVARAHFSGSRLWTKKMIATFGAEIR